jgi:alpha-D-xyloside xylohydrolase
MDYTAQKPADPITLYVYTGRDASFTIYEDEGINYNYEKGQYAHIPIYYDQGTHSLTIGERRGSFPGMPENRTFQIEWVAAAHPVGMSLVSGSSELIQYNGKPVTLKLF